MASGSLGEDLVEVDETLQEMQDELARLLVENSDLRASLATLKIVKENQEKVLKEVRAKLVAEEKEKARILSQSKDLRDDLDKTKKELNRVSKRSHELDALLQNYSDDNNKLTKENAELTDQTRDLSDRNEKLTAVEIELKSKLEASSQASREKEVAMKTFRATWSDDLKNLKEDHENFIKGLEEEWRVTQEEFQEKLSSCEAEKREIRKKILEFEASLKDEKEKGAGQDELIKALKKEVADGRNWAKSTRGRFSPRLPRRGLHASDSV